MELIITEKNIAAARIAELLSGGKIPQGNLNGAPIYRFDDKGKEIVVFPLRGHIVDVDFPAMYSNWLGTDVKKLVDVPAEYIEKEKTIINALKKIAKDAGNVVIATDADREGEAIGVEAVEIIRKQNPKAAFKRAIFSAITKKEIDDAFADLKEVDYNLSDSANSRREIDLVWGAALTRFLSLISGRLGKDFLSVGRVQTPVLALIVSREKERLAFISKKYWQIRAVFEKDEKDFEAFHKEGNFWEQEKAKTAFSKKADYGTVKDVSKKKKVLKKPAPFNTTEFQRAATALGFGAAEAMDLAEFLYQSGYTSYPRTDNQCYPPSVNLKEILEELAKNSILGEDAKKILAQKKIEPSAGKLSKDHPPIYPVANCPKEKVNPKQWRIYELIARRFFATLAEDAIVDATSIAIDLAGEPYTANGQIIVSMGWKGFYPYSKIEETLLPELAIGDRANLKSHELLEKETIPPARYSQAALIKKMEELGLGTKATRAGIIQKLYYRKYISGSKSIEPHKIAFALIDVLQKDADTITKHEMTSDLEKEMDEVALGKRSKDNVVEESRGLLRGVVDELSEKKKDISGNIRSAMKEDSYIGTCLKCGSPLRILTSRMGKRFAACSGYPNCKNTFPLPQKGGIEATGKKCEFCAEAVIKVVGKRYRFEMCINPNCKTKDEWKKKMADAAEAKAQEAGKKIGESEGHDEAATAKKAKEAMPPTAPTMQKKIAKKIPAKTAGTAKKAAKKETAKEKKSNTRKAK